MKRILTLVLALMLVASCFAAMAEGELISVISKGEQHAFWQTCRKGCQDAADEYGAELYYYGPPSESDIALQVEALNGEIQKQPSAICLAALSVDAVMGQMQQCADAGIPVIGFDSGVPGAPEGSVRATACTDNQAAAAMAADKIYEQEGVADAIAAATADAPFVIGLMVQDVTSDSVTSRATGFVNRMTEIVSEVNTISVVGHDKWAAPVDGAGVIIQIAVPASTDITDMANAASSLLNTEGLKAVFLSNEGVVNGFLAATSTGADLAEGGIYSDLLVCGFDAGATQKNAIREGWFFGSVTQDPYHIGYYAVEMAIKAARGEEVADKDTGAKWYNAENIDTPEIAELVYD